MNGLHATMATIASNHIRMSIMVAEYVKMSDDKLVGFYHLGFTWVSVVTMNHYCCYRVTYDCHSPNS